MYSNRTPSILNLMALSGTSRQCRDDTLLLRVPSLTVRQIQLAAESLGCSWLRMHNLFALFVFIALSFAGEEVEEG